VAFDVFISYSGKDKPVADAACAALEGANVRCWMAPRDISPGRDYGESIITAIEGAKVLVLLFSESANASPQIKREVERAVSKGLPIVPVRIADVMPTGSLEYFISSPHWLDAFPPPREKYFAKLIDSVQALCGDTRPSGAERGPHAAGARVPPQRWRQLLPAAMAIALLFVSAGTYIEYRAANQTLLLTLTGHGDQAGSVSFTPDGKTIAAGGWDAAVEFWDTSNGQLQPPAISDFYGHAAPFSPDGKWIAGGSNNDVKLWDSGSRRILRTYSGHTDKVLTVAFSPDGKALASGGSDHIVFLWNVAGNQPGRRLIGHDDQVYSVAFSPDGDWVASAGFDKKVIVWDVASGQPKKTLTGANKMTAAIFSPDRGWLATAGWDGNVTVWDIDTWQAVRVFPGTGQIVTSIAFSPNGKLLVSGGYDNTVKIWNTLTGALVRTFAGHTDAIWDVAFSPDGRWVASASGDKTVRIWKAP
jgi:WD40 repeat protein